jgi:hypothetical protein
MAGRYDNPMPEATTGCRPPAPPLPLCVAQAGGNHVNEEIIPLLPTGIGERYSQTISKLGHTARSCADVNSPLETKVMN